MKALAGSPSAPVYAPAITVFDLISESFRFPDNLPYFTSRSLARLSVPSSTLLRLSLYPCGVPKRPFLWFSPNIIQFHSFVFRLGSFGVSCE